MAEGNEQAPMTATTMAAIARTLDTAGAHLPAGLYLVATPIGHLADITIRALAVLRRADVLVCEDTRHSRTLLAHYGLDRPLRPYHDHSDAGTRDDILAHIASGRSVALISDAGTPLISDPGFKLARDAARAGHAVVSVPGPSAVLTALTVSGLPTDAFHFAGFLPPKPTARRARLAALATIPATLVLFEAPSRLAAMLEDAAAILGDREAVIARELTKRFEEVQRAPLAELARDAAGRGEADRIRGEIVVLIGPPPQQPVDDDQIAQRLSALRATLSLKDASRQVAAELGVPRSRVYDLGLKLEPGAASS